jgi:hypothetical protein
VFHISVDYKLKHFVWARGKESFHHAGRSVAVRNIFVNQKKFLTRIQHFGHHGRNDAKRSNELIEFNGNMQIEKVKLRCAESCRGAMGPGLDSGRAQA